MTAPIEEYVDIVRRDAFRRRLIQGLEELIARAQVEEDRLTLVSELHDTVVRISSNVSNDNLISPIQAVELYETQIELRRAGLRGGLPYGFAALDAILNPAMPGDMIVLAARPSVGKTALAENIADSWAHQAEGPVLFASLEMSVGSIMDRTIARLTGLPAKKVVRGILDDAEAALATSTAEQRRSVNLWYLDDGNATTASLRAAAAKTRLMAVEMRAEGLTEVAGPSGMFLSERSGETSGTLVFPAIEGTRPLLVEVQALVSQSFLAMPRRTTLGVDYNRVILMCAILERKAGVSLYNQDVFVNVAGGVRLSEPAADLGVALALASPIWRNPFPWTPWSLGR